MNQRIILTLFILLGTIIEIVLVWLPNFFTNETLRYIASIFGQFYIFSIKIRNVNRMTILLQNF